MKQLFLIIITIVLFSSCATQKKISYFQNVQPNVEFEYLKGKDITVQSDDMLSIVVSSRNPELAMLFNLPRVQQLVGTDGQDLSQSTSRGELSDRKSVV